MTREEREAMRAELASRTRLTPRRKARPKTGRRAKTHRTGSEGMSATRTVIQKTATRRISVATVELIGAPRVSLYEEEFRAGRWAVTRFGFTLDPEQVPELIEALRGVSK